MTDIKPEDVEEYPIAPRYHPIHKIPRKIYDFFASARLAIFLLITLLACCLTGVTLLRGEQAWRLIFSTLWFNGLLVLLVVNVACCFFGRIWGRRITVISFGMILFHLSFVAMFIGIVYGSLFSFVGSLRLTEGESLVNSDPASYDILRHGRFFRFESLQGTTSLDRVHVGYTIDGKNKRVAYEVSISEDSEKKTATIYATNSMTYEGVSYFRDKEGFSPRLSLHDSAGKEIYSAYIALQSLEQKDGSYLYTTGSKKGPGSFPFPQMPVQSQFNLQLTYLPSKLVDRGGEVFCLLYPLATPDSSTNGNKPFAEEKIPVGGSFTAGAYKLSVDEVNYWASMTVRYDPGKPVVLASLWFGLAGMIITTVGRMRQGRRR